MEKRKWKKSPEPLVEAFFEVMNEFPDIELRKMFGYPCAFLNGNMCVGLHEDNMAVRISAAFRDEALQKKIGFIFAPMNGRVMKEYIALAPEILADRSKLRAIISTSLEYVKTLPKKTPK